MLQTLETRLTGKSCGSSLWGSKKPFYNRLPLYDANMLLVSRNIYGSHPFYLDTRYFEFDDHGSHRLVASDQADQSKNYVSYSHGVFMRNAHGQEVLTHSQNLTWRTLGGSIDLTFYSGPSQVDVTKNYLTSTIGLPAMQQYFAFGYHQCRWGYQNWSVVENVVDNFEKAGIPLENMWSVDVDLSGS